jgi:stage II sporulation protein D
MTSNRSVKWLCRIFIMSSLIMLLSVYSYANPSITIPQKINIGIRFGQSAVPLISLYSANGLEVGYYDGEEFKSRMRFFENKDILVRQDHYFMNINGTFVQYDFNEDRDKENKMIQGPIHIQIGESFNHLEEAQSFLQSLPKFKGKPYIAYENGWKVWIGLYTSNRTAQEAIEEMKESISGEEFKIISEDSKRIQVLDRSGQILLMYHSGNTPHAFRAIYKNNTTNLIQLDGKNFRGDLLVTRNSDSDLTVINRLNLEEYLYGVVPREMSGEWPIEAQKAQAIAARNFTVKNLNNHAHYGFDLCATTHCQAYGGYDIEHPKSRMAVDQTRGELLTYKDEVITAFYHSNSGGCTENSENVWSAALPYIQGVEDPYSIGCPNDKWTFTYTKKQIEDILSSKGISVGSLTNMAVTEYSKNGRVLKLKIDGTSGSTTLEKEKIRSIFGYNNIKSTWFELSGNVDHSIYVLEGDPLSSKQLNLKDKFVVNSEGVKPLASSQSPYLFNGTRCQSVSTSASKEYVFTGKGWGHGLGMSQWGAKKMAEDGFNYEQILTHYYTGTNVRRF